MPDFMSLIRLLLFPLSLLYGLVILIRNYVYDAGILKSEAFRIPVISVGNLAVGGAGKSPMIEYLLTLVDKQYKVAVLSRGYGRKTKGFLEVNLNDDADQTGDEPLQFKHKFPGVTVAVCENRVEGINRLKGNHELILLDDAYQHRAVKPGLSILLFEYTSFNKTQLLLPAGNLREPLNSIGRADIIVVTKTPVVLNDAEEKSIISKLETEKPVLFSYLKYDDLKGLYQPQILPLKNLQNSTQLFLLTGIANPEPLLNELKRHTPLIRHHEYPDHHRFSTKNISKLVSAYKESKAADKLIITTEKDAQRLRSKPLKHLLDGLPVFYLPVKSELHLPGKHLFNQQVIKYVTEYSAHNRIHQA